MTAQEIEPSWCAIRVEINAHIPSFTATQTLVKMSNLLGFSCVAQILGKDVWAKPGDNPQELYKKFFGPIP